MSRTRLRTVMVAAALLLTTPLALTAAPVASSTRDPQPRSDESAQVVLDWERTLFATVYPATAIPSGVPILGFTSMAMYDAAATSASFRGRSSETAAVATAAYDLLLHYVPKLIPAPVPPPGVPVPIDPVAVKAKLDAALAASLAQVKDPRALARGSRFGHEAAARMIASRVSDNYGNAEIHYLLPPGVGVWQPTAPAADMLGAWIGSLRPLVVAPDSPVDGPDPLTSKAYARDYREVRRLGGTVSMRTQAQTDTATFFNVNSATMVGDALIRRLESRPTDLVATARVFAAMHASMTDTLIQCWQLKRDVGFWRPFQAIPRAAEDGNRLTRPDPSWTPLLPQPNYSDYVSGHGCLTGPAIEVIRATFGERTALELWSVNGPPRVYRRLAAIEAAAESSRVWGGFHFRDAVADAYVIGHQTARRVLAAMARH